MASGANRVVIGLPERYEKAKAEVAKLEARNLLAQHMVRQYLFTGEGVGKVLLEILNGDYDDSAAATILDTVVNASD